jgi:energy-coupling factor transporter ATP-binding protein EcfA2
VTGGPTIVVDGVRYAYPDGDEVLGGVDLEIAAGEAVLLVGSSGSGKSTLLRTLNGLVPHTSGGRFGGDVRVGERSTRDHRPRDFADLVGFVHQDPEAQFVVDRVEGDVAFVLENLGYEPAAMRRRVEEAMDAVGIAHLRDRSPTTLSGGERQRAAIAGALAAAPPVLVLDEPTSELDPQGAEDVLAAVQRLNFDLGATVVLAEHRLERAAHLVDRAVVLEAGQVVASGLPADTLATYPGAPPVTQLGHLLGWDPAPLTVRDARAHLRRSGDVAGRLGTPRGRGGHPSAGEPLLEARGLSVVHDRRTVLSGIDVRVDRGRVLALLGRNGSGKTTLLRALAGLHDPAGGTVARHGSVAYVPQDPNTLLFAPTVRAELAETLRLRHRPDEGTIDRWLERLGLTALADAHPRSLSAGARQRVAIAAIAVGGAEVLLLDEPTRGIDAASAAALRAAIDDHVQGGGAVVLATHDTELAAVVADDVMVLGDGDVVAHGDARAVLSGSLFAPQVLRVLPPFLTVGEVAEALARAEPVGGER